MRPLVVGISGASGSGKSTFCSILSRELDDYKVDVISTDSYFKACLPKMKSPVTQKEYDDFNHPESLDHEKFMNDLAVKLENENSADIVIIEGITVLYFEDIRQKLDLKIFVELDSDERMYRRIKRNMQMFGISMDEIAEYYLESAKYREKEYVLLTKVFADIILNGSNLDGKAKDVVTSWIRSKLA